jgi:hypothetical protein
VGVEPPFVGVAVKVEEVAEHTSVVGELILTEGVTFGFTVILTALLVAGLPVAHGLAFEVITTVTWSPLPNPEFV